MICDGQLWVSLMDKSPFIYNFNHNAYSNKVIQGKLWEEISTEMNIDHMFVKSYKI